MIKKYNQFINESYKELVADQDMMYKTSHILNLIRRYDEVENIIKTTLNTGVYNKLFGDYSDMIKKPFDVFCFFITTVIDSELLKKMFKTVTLQEGADFEDEHVVALEIKGKVVLLLHSERGSSIRIQDDNHTITEKEVIAIIKELCEIYNDKLSHYLPRHK